MQVRPSGGPEIAGGATFEPWPAIRLHVTGSWHVPKAPPPYDDREWQMIASLLGIQTALSGVGLALRLFGRRP